MSNSQLLMATLDLAAAAERADDVLASILKVDGVLSAGLVKPDAKTAAGRSAAYIQVEDSADLADTCEKVRDVDGVRNCSIPARRYAL